MQSEYEIALSNTPKDTEGWDDFLSHAKGNDLLQSSLWAQLKATVGWRVLRLIVRQENCIVGGAQILIRPLPFFLGSVGYIPRGPILACAEPTVSEFIVHQLLAVARRHRLQILIVQPPRGHTAIVDRLMASDFRPSSIRVAPSATMRIDLRMEPETILAQMKSGTRYNIRRGQREGICVRDGCEADLSVFSQLHAASSQRQGFSTYSEEYFESMWKLLAQAKRVHLLIAEYEGEAVSAMLLAAFGNTVWAKRFGWSGKHSKRAPNDALVWGAITWAKEQGYHYFDQDGIARRAAVALANDEPVPKSVIQTPTYFKLGFGGQALLFPEAYAHIYNPFVRFVYTSLFTRISLKSTRKKVVNLLRLG